MSKKTTSNDNKDKLKDIVGPTDNNIDKLARDRLTQARISLLLKHSFFGNLATRLRLVNADEWLPTLATDGRYFYYNSRFVQLLSDKEIEFGFGHEVLHCVYDHFGRRGHRDRKIWNFAGDYCINLDLVKHNIGTKITTVEILYDTKYEGLSSEQVYDDIMKNVKKINLDELADMLLDDHLDGDDGEDGGGKCQTCDGTGQVNDGQDGGGQEGQTGQGGGGSKECPDCNGSGRKGRPKLSKEERDQIRDEFREAVISAAQQEKNAGNLPGSVRQMIKDLTEPKMDWREILNLTLTSSIKDDYTFQRVSRRSWHIPAILPGMNPGEEVDIAVAIDTSGSISDSMLRDFLSEVQGCMESFTAYKIHLYSFDTNFHNPQDFSSDDISSISEYKPGGGGGTEFSAIFKHLKEEEIVPERLVVFTDGYPWGSWGDEDYCDTLWIIHGSTDIVAPFGTTAYYEDHRS